MKIGKIEKGIVAPARMRNDWTPFLDNMEIGDSRFVDREGENLEKVRTRIGGFLYRWARGKNRKFTVGQYKDGLMIWRVK